MNPLKELLEQGQSVWLDYIRRNLIISGELKKLVEEDGIRGVTSNPTIFEKAIAHGVNVNITLMFSMAHYEAVARAYIKGLERCADPSKVASVASFFVSRVDTMVDRALESLGTPQALALMGKIAVANSKIVYDRFREIFHGEGFAALRQRGARVQRPLWASTGTKNPKYSDVLYVENLIGSETVNTMPPDTIKAFKDHGKVIREAVRENLDEAAAALGQLKALGIDLNAIAEKLQEDGVVAFAASFDQLMAALDKKRKSMRGRELNHQELHLGKLQRRVNRRLKDWQAQQFGSRLWNRDNTLWSPNPLPELTDRLGSRECPETMEKQVA